MFFKKLSLYLMVLAATLFLSLAAKADEKADEKAGEIGIATGSKTGTYIKFGQDIARLLAKNDMQVNIIESKGSLENVAKVLSDDQVDMGLVQSDVLAYIQSSNHKVLKKIPQQIKMMFPLYNEEVHLLARKSIVSIGDLQNKIVGVGAKGSGTNLTSELLFEISNVWPQRKVLMGEAEALRALEAGELDAMIFVSGYPVNLFSSINNDKLHLVSLTEELFDSFYARSTIPAGTYPWQPEPVETLAVKAMLMTYDFVDERCAFANQMTKLIQDNLAWFSENGHPKWQEVNLDISLPQWERYPCVEQFFGDGKRYFTGRNE